MMVRTVFWSSLDVAIAIFFFVLTFFPGQVLDAAESKVVPAVAPINEVGSDDLLKFEIFDNPDLTSLVRVPKQGGVSFPLVGDLPSFIGQTPQAIAADLKRRLEDGYLRHAQVTVTVIEYGPRSAVVMGSVVKPGRLDLPPTRPMTVLEAIGASGGFTEDANRTGAALIRDQADGQRLSEPLDLAALAANPALDRRMQPGDILVVPRLDRIIVIGQVVKPGSVPVANDTSMTVSKAIGLAGGFDRFARTGKVALVRPGEAVRTIDVAAVLAGDRDVEDPQLKPGDTVFVPESRF